MRKIFKLDQILSSNPGVSIKDDAVHLAYESGQFNFHRSERKNVRIHVDRARGRGKQIEIVGWAFGRENEHPIKRIYMSFDNRMLASGEPVLRTDVRRVFHLDYDHYGFKIRGEAAFNVFDGDAVDLFVLDGTGLIHVPTTITGSGDPVRGILQVSDDSVVINAEVPEQRRQFSIAQDIKLHIDRGEVTSDEVKVRGWCFDRILPDERPLVCVVKGKTIVSEFTPCRLKRSDVAEAHGLVSRNPYQGFEVKFKRAELQDEEPLKVLAITGSEGTSRAALAQVPYKKLVYRE